MLYLRFFIPFCDVITISIQRFRIFQQTYDTDLREITVSGPRHIPETMPENSADDNYEIK